MLFAADEEIASRHGALPSYFQLGLHTRMCTGTILHRELVRTGSTDHHLRALRWKPEFTRSGTCHALNVLDTFQLYSTNTSSLVVGFSDVFLSPGWSPGATIKLCEAHARPSSS